MAEFQVQPDSAPILPQGTGAPYLAIFNSQLSVIKDPKSNLPLGSFVTSFEYTYEEGSPDKGKFTVEIDNPEIVALTELGYQQGLQLQWGWIYGNGNNYCGPVRRVIITGHDVEFGTQGVKFTIEFSDTSALLKNIPSSYYDNTKGFVQYVEDLCKGLPIGLTLIDYNTQNVVTPKVAQRVETGEEINRQYPSNRNTGAAWAIPNTAPISPREIVQTPTTVCPDAAGVKLLEYNPTTKKLTIEDPDTFRKIYLQESQTSAGLVLGTSRSKYYQIQDACRGLSNGPFFVDSRDGEIVIHNAKATRPILKVYTYAGGYGELLTFTIKSTFVKSSVEVKETNEINPDSKDIETTFVQGIIDPDAGNEDGKDIDAYMVWPNIGSPYFPTGAYMGNVKPPYRASSLNQGYITQPGTSGSAPGSAAWQPLGRAPETQERTSTNLVIAPNNTTVSAKAEKPNAVVSASRIFDNVNEAKKYYNAHPQVSQAEINQYYSDWINDWNSKKVTSDVEQLFNVAHQLDRIPPFKITRKVKIVTRVNLENLGGSMGLLSSSDVEAQTESFRNAITSGQIDLSSYNEDYAESRDKRGARTRDSMMKRSAYVKNALTLLEKAGITATRRGQKDRSDWADVSFEMDLTVELDGMDITAGANSINIGGTLGNDIIESITNQVKAEATVIGDPAIESSMNIQIQNISSKYSGLWYTKKVTHTMGKNGYLTQIEFVQRTVPISTVTLKSNWSKKDYGGNLIEAAKLAKETGSYNPSAIEQEVKSQLKAHPGQSVVAQVDVKTGEIKYSQRDLVSGEYLVRIDGNVDYTNNFQDYIQDLQKYNQ